MSTVLGPTYERESVGDTLTHTQYLRRIAYEDDAGAYQHIVNDWIDGGHPVWQHAVETAPFIIAADNDGNRRVFPTRDLSKWFGLGQPIVKVGGAWTPIDMGSPDRIGNMLRWEKAQANMYTFMAGHEVKQAILLKGGWEPEEGKIAFEVELHGLSRQGRVFYDGDDPVMSVQLPIVYDYADPTDTREVAVDLVQISGSWYVLLTLPDLSGMSQPLIDPTLTLQPDATDGQDTFFSPGSAAQKTNNYGTSVAGIAVSNLTYLWAWDLSTVSNSAVVSSVVMSLWNTLVRGTNRSMNVYQLAAANNAWPEGTHAGAVGGAGDSCWNYLDQDSGSETAWAGGTNGCAVAGTDYVNTLLGTFTYTANDPAGTEIQCTFNADGISAVEGACGSTFHLVGLGSSFTVGPDMSDGVTAAERPKLVVTYSIPGGAAFWHGWGFTDAANCS